MLSEFEIKKMFFQETEELFETLHELEIEVKGSWGFKVQTIVIFAPRMNWNAVIVSEEP